MLVLTVRTDKPEAEIRLFQDQTQLGELVWHAHRELGTTIHKQISALLANSNKQLTAIEGIVVYEGPGSFTGLRIGLSVANALADGLKLPIIAAGNDDWQQQGIERLLAGQTDTIALPKYGAPVTITVQKK